MLAAGPSISIEPVGFVREELSLDDFSALDATGANANALVAALKLRLHGTEIDAPTATGDVMCVRNVIAELRTFATNAANLSHDLLQYF
jgi:hypothetical protein